MKINKKKAFTLFALTLLVASLLLVNMNGPTSAQASTDLIYLHGPALTPIHMHSNITLKPIHMHALQGLIDLYKPMGTMWHELYPTCCPIWNLTSWIEMQLPGDPGYGQLSPNDQIDMNLTLPAMNLTEYYHVDRITVTLLLSGPYPGENHTAAPPTMAIEVKLPFYPTESWFYWPNFMNTLWHEVWPNYSNVYNLTSFTELFPGNNILDTCDSIDLKNMSQPQVPPTYWHVEQVATDLILRQKMTKPLGTWWHELYPQYSTWYNLTSWEDTVLRGFLSPSDQIDMTEKTSGNKTLYYVDRVTITINVTWQPQPGTTQWMMLELKTQHFEEMYEAFKHPVPSSWHEVYPNYCNVYNITRWDFFEDDNCNGVLDPCDYIWLLNMTGGDQVSYRYHIEDMSYDIILNKKITDPVCTTWHELHPTYCNEYHIDAWKDTQPEGELGHGLLSPYDNVTMNQEEYHVENVTLTLNLTSETQTSIYVESMLPFEQMYLPKTMPVGTPWHGVYPDTIFCTNYNLTGWTDNCNGVLDYCDNITLTDINTGDATQYHVDEVAVDMVVEKPVAPPPPPPMLWKENYPDYAPSGVPDFYQRQDLFNVTGMWTWCVPVAVANSLWWMDSRFDSDPNGSRLLTNYTAGIDDHDPKNVQPFIQHLARLMDTDGIRTQSGLTAHYGTLVLDMQTGIAHYLSWTGVNPLGDVNGDGVTNQTDYNIALAANNTQPGVVGWNMAADIYPVTLGWPTPGVADNKVNQSDLDLINAHMNETGMFYEKTMRTPDFQFVEDEVERCEDVILLLDFYDEYWHKPTGLKELGHAVTVAGVNSTSQPPRIAISDPDMDNAEPPLHGNNGPGRVLPEGVPHVHNATPPDTLHNNASYVSHDIYNVTFVTPPPWVSNASWALANYPMGPYIWAVVEWAVIVSPLAPVGVCGVDVTNVTVSHCNLGTLVSETYKTWTLKVNVTVHNNGTLPVNCTVNAYYYNITNTYQIGTEQNITNLPPCNSTTLTFNWDCSGLPVGVTYTVKANATCPCGASDEFVNGQMKKRPWGDVNANGIVGPFDFGDVSKMYLIYSGVITDPGVVPYGDINGNCIVGPFDFGDVSKMYLIYSGILNEEDC